MAIWLGCVILHLILAPLAQSPWWVPQLTLLGMLIGILKRPKAWFLLSLLTAWVMNFWTIRLGYSLCFMLLAIGFIEQWILSRWELNDAPPRLLLFTAAVVLADLGMIWLEDSWSWTQLGLCLLHAAVTAVAALFILEWAIPGRKPSSIQWRRFASVKNLPLVP